MAERKHAKCFCIRGSSTPHRGCRQSLQRYLATELPRLASMPTADGRLAQAPGIRCDVDILVF
jgi:hypothetical protein